MKVPAAISNEHSPVVYGRRYPATVATGFTYVNYGYDITASQMWDAVPAPEESDRPLLQTEGLFSGIFHPA